MFLINEQQNKRVFTNTDNCRFLSQVFVQVDEGAVRYMILVHQFVAFIEIADENFESWMSRHIMCFYKETSLVKWR